MKLPDDIETNILLRNNTPVDDFWGLSPTEIHHRERIRDTSHILFKRLFATTTNTAQTANTKT